VTNATRPAQPNEITAEWLTAVVQANGDDGVVDSFELRTVGEGVGMMGVLNRIIPHYSSGSGPASMIAKFAATNDANLGVAVTFDIYRREVLFYRHLAGATGMRVPHILFDAIEGPSDFVLVMEDLTGYQMGDQISGCSPQQAMVCMDEMAKLHATFWGRVGGPEFDFVPYHYPTFHSATMLQAAEGGWDNFTTVFADRVPQFMIDIKDRYFAAVPAMQAWLNTDPITLVHGDFRMDNLMFGSGPEQSAVAVLDWQGTLRCKAAQDVAYLLSHSIEVEERRVHERSLIAHWHAQLLANGVTDYTPEQAWEDYRRAVLYLWVYVMVIAGALDASNDRGRRWMSEMITRSATAIEDLGGLDLLPEFETPPAGAPASSA
jgi:aminoglycoside phosphotransferase (APT) family kinase protein